jgi:hypothetical protein
VIACEFFLGNVFVFGVVWLKFELFGSANFGSIPIGVADTDTDSERSLSA